MNKYFVQGSDQKEYGPITEKQVRRWILENRLNGSTPARADGESIWKLIRDYPEFTQALGGSQSVKIPPTLDEAPKQATPDISELNTISCQLCHGNGTMKKFREIPFLDICPYCKGSGTQSAGFGARESCRNCRGSRMHKSSRREEYEVRCPMCLGRGR